MIVFMMQPSTVEALQQEIAEAVVRSADPEKVYLFGSFARGDAGPDSDLDLLIVERQPFDGHRRRSDELQKIRKSLSAFRLSKDILLYSADEFAKWSQSPNHVVARCLREGRLIYERSAVQ